MLTIFLMQLNMLVELLLLKEDIPKLIDDIEIAYRSLENFRI